MRRTNMEKKRIERERERPERKREKKRSRERRREREAARRKEGEGAHEVAEKRGQNRTVRGGNAHFLIS